jgi:hypothetical protein
MNLRQNRIFSADRPTSFRQEFDDECYDLNHPELIENEDEKMVAQFDIRRGYSPPNLVDDKDDKLVVEQVVLFFALKDG